MNLDFLPPPVTLSDEEPIAAGERQALMTARTNKQAECGRIDDRQEQLRVVKIPRLVFDATAVQYPMKSK